MLSVKSQLLSDRHSDPFPATDLGNVALQDLAVVFDWTPQVMYLTVDLYEDLIDVPAPMSEACIRLIRWR